MAESTMDNTATSNSAKRLRQSCKADDSDWNFLLKSMEFRHISKDLSSVLHLTKPQFSKEDATNSIETRINHNSVFFTSIRLIQFTLHVLYEELKLNVLRKRDLRLLANFLSKISYDLNLEDYQRFYWLDFPEHCNPNNYTNRVKINANQLKSIIIWNTFDNKPFGIYQFLYNLIQNKIDSPFPYIHNVNARTKDVIQVRNLKCL